MLEKTEPRSFKMQYYNCSPTKRCQKGSAKEILEKHKRFQLSFPCKKFDDKPTDEEFAYA